jgi:GNAT superfamily N-acetyltransferase
MHKPANEKLIDQATQKLREHGIALIPNILVGLPGETAETYAHTLDFLNRNKDIISHANIYNLAVYPDAELAKKLTTASEGDFNENVLEKSFHSDPKVHRQFAGDLYGTAQNMLEGKPSSAALDMWAKAPEANGLKRIEDLKPEDLQFEEGRRNWAARAVESHRTTGGFTIHPETGMVPEKGHVIEVSPEHRQPVEGVLQPEDVEKFHQENKKLFAENPELHVGGYGNQLNVSAVGTPEGARLVGNKLDQESGWDAEKHQVVPYEGKGVQTKFPDYPLAQRLAELKTTPENPLNTEVNATPAMKKLVDKTPWEGGGEDLNRLEVKDNGKVVGAVYYNGQPQYGPARIEVTHLDPEYRNQGVGKEMYKSAIENARKQGFKTFKSDTTVSNDAQNVWNSLMREGKYNITKEYTKNFNANGGGGVEYTVHLNEPKENPLNAEVRAPRIVDGQDVVEHLMKTAKIDENEAMGRTGTYGAGHVEAGDDYNPALAKKFAEKSTPLPAIVLGPDGDVRDGNHRIAAAEMRGDKTVKAYVPVGYPETEKMIAASQGKESAATPEEDFAFGRNVEGTPDQQKGLVSTRVPSGVKATENPIEKDLVIGREAIYQVPGMAEKMAKLVREYPGVKIPENIKDPDKVLNRFVDHAKENLKALYNSVPPERREANMKWYDSANKLASNLAEKYGHSTKQAAGVIAAMSPQKDWDMNVGLAERVNDIFHTQKDTQTSPEMLVKGQEIINKTNWKNPLEAKANRNLAGVLSTIEGKTFGELTDPIEKAAWIRLYDEAHNSRQYHSIDPATGESRGIVVDGAGKPRSIAWGSLKEISKAISILEDGSRENISDKLGDAHKVRNFYNNLLDPNNTADHVTIDTHAVGAALMRPMSGKSPEVLHNFGAGGAPSSTINGVNGLYPLYADAYRLAAKDLGIQPRQLQSVVWGEIRNMFPAEMKRIPRHVDAVNDIWQQYGEGKISLDKAHEKVQTYAKQAAGEMASNRAAGKISAHQFLERLGQGGLFALAGGK